MEKATPRQVAYLKFMGYSDADSYTKEQAGIVIENLGNQDNYKTFEEFAGVQERIARWTRQRFYDYPDLYASRRQDEIELAIEELRSFIRSRVVGASERLTERKIRDVLGRLEKENWYWWLDDDRKCIFFETLERVYPGCTDGSRPIRKEVPSTEPPPLPPSESTPGSFPVKPFPVQDFANETIPLKKGGCVGVIVVLVIVVTVALLYAYGS